MSETTSSAPLRADAERNRMRIVEAACALFSRRGIDVPLEDIAREAGVGIGTLYRRFGAREELMAAAYVRKFADYVAVIDRAASEADAWSGVVAFVEGVCDLQANDASLRDLLTIAFADSPEVDELIEIAQAKLALILERAIAADAVRSDLVIEDLALVVLGNAGVVARAQDHAPRSSPRFAALMLEAFRREPSAAKLPAPPTAQQLREALSR